jgi:hypothetical protein
MRRHRPGRLLLPPVLLVFILAGATAGEAGDLAGRWILSEQRYEGGGAGLVPVDPPLRLRLERSATGLEVSVWRGERRLPWPSLVDDDGVVPITVLERSADPGGERLRVLWRAEPEGDGRSAMEVEQVLTAGPEDTLRETVRISLFLDGAPRGGYTLTRRYEREGGRP